LARSPRGHAGDLPCPEAGQVGVDQVTYWPDLLDSFANQLNPLHQELFALYPSAYYWTCFQSEWATDIVFRDAAVLQRLMSILVPHALSSFSCKDVLRYFHQRINQSGEIPANFHGTAQINLKHYQEGQRVKYALTATRSRTTTKLTRYPGMYCGRQKQSLTT
jgi:hypothetical protein